jgi:hypothetical protein
MVVFGRRFKERIKGFAEEELVVVVVSKGFRSGQLEKKMMLHLIINLVFS